MPDRRAGASVSVLCPVREADWNAGCEADVSCAHTSLGLQGDAWVAGFTDEHGDPFMHDRGSRPHLSLQHGSALRATEH